MRVLSFIFVVGKMPHFAHIQGLIIGVKQVSQWKITNSSRHLMDDTDLFILSSSDMNANPVIAV